ncbi:MAG: transposase [Myxococcales bacterium]|nr:transposase [Myxococcales bacterium]
MPPLPGSGQLSLFAPSQSPLVTLDANHRLVRLTELLDWARLEEVAQSVRHHKLKSRAGRRPNLRVMLGAVALMGTRRMTYREAEDQIRHYGPARYLCGLTDSTWTPDHTTIQDFTELMGPGGMAALNEVILQCAADSGCLDARLAVGDTTAQEAPMSYPTEVGLMSRFARMVGIASKRVGGAMRDFARDIKSSLQRAREFAGKYRFFSKSKEERLSAGQKLLNVVKGVNKKLKKSLGATAKSKSRLKKFAKVARRKLESLHEAMNRLTPQIQYWLDTGYVAKNKLINLLMPEVCSIPRGKAGKDVEFGVKWGLTRLGGGFLLPSADATRGNFNDKKHVIESVKDCIRLFRSAPKRYAYDRGGYSPRNVSTLRVLGVKEPGLSPAGKAAWPVDGNARKQLKRERVKVEGSIGALKSGRYTFNRPLVRSTHMMLACGYRAILGYNLNRWLNLSAARDGVQLVGA